MQNKSYQFVHLFKLNWHKAAAYCRSQGLFLVSIHNEAQLEGIMRYLNETGYYQNENILQVWTSGNDLGEYNQFVWTSTGERIVIDRWTRGEPNHVLHNKEKCMVEHCVALQHYTTSTEVHPVPIVYSLDDRPCEWQYNFICESLDG
uniref:C-type lectin domain-containing protein n=1 Tax=Anopheles minimus TaxID=112268 RepID=A0A182WCV7_9DIPT